MSHEAFMKEALKEAQAALEKGEVPIGAVLVKEERILGRGHNLREGKRDPTAHAEIIALQEGSRALNSWRLTGTTLYVTVEPCPMCAGALIQARVKRLVFGVRDSKAGVCGSLYNLVQDDRFNHQIEVVEGIMEQDCRRIMQEFFQKLRK